MDMQTELTQTERSRYSRHLLLPEVSLAGQTRLKETRVLVVGAGGLGCPVALYLAAAGVGTIGLVDFDRIDYSNLQRQILYATDQVGQSKVQSAAQRLRALNDTINVIEHEVEISATEVMDIISDYQIIVDGTDNFSTRYLLNDACVIARKPYVYGSIFRFDGQASVFTHETGCYRCLFPQPPDQGTVPNCAEAGVLGVLPAMIGTIQATEVIKLSLGIGSSLKGRFILYDALNMSFEELRLKRNPECAVCGDNPSITKPMDQTVQCAPLSNGPSDPESTEISTDQLAQLLSKPGVDFTLLDVRNSEEHAICKLNSAILIPLSELESRMSELEKTKEIIAYCKGGTRSTAAVKLLHSKGYRARSLVGGILAWAEQQDPTLTRY